MISVGRYVVGIRLIQGLSRVVPRCKDALGRLFALLTIDKLDKIEAIDREDRSFETCHDDSPINLHMKKGSIRSV